MNIDITKETHLHTVPAVEAFGDIIIIIFFVLCSRLSIDPLIAFLQFWKTLTCYSRVFGNIHIHNKRTVYFIPNFSPSTYTFYNQCTLNNNVLQSMCTQQQRSTINVHSTTKFYNLSFFSAITYPKYNKYSSKVSATRNTYEKQ